MFSTLFQPPAHAPGPYKVQLYSTYVFGPGQVVLRQGGPVFAGCVEGMVVYSIRV